MQHFHRDLIVPKLETKPLRMSLRCDPFQSEHPHNHIHHKLYIASHPITSRIFKCCILPLIYPKCLRSFKLPAGFCSVDIILKGRKFNTRVTSSVSHGLLFYLVCFEPPTKRKPILLPDKRPFFWGGVLDSPHVSSLWIPKVTETQCRLVLEWWIHAL